MKTLTELAARNGVDLRTQAADDIEPNPTLDTQEREALLEDALGTSYDDPHTRTRPYSKGARTPNVLTTRRFEFEEAPKVRDIALLDHPTTESSVYRYRLDSFHSWVKLLRALVGGPLYFRIPPNEQAAADQVAPRQKAM